MAVDAPVRPEAVFMTGPAILTRWSFDDAATAAPKAEPVSEILAFYTRMVKKYESLPPLEHHTHERPVEHNSF